jgi:hypothetical protein
MREAAQAEDAANPASQQGRFPLYQTLFDSLLTYCQTKDAYERDCLKIKGYLAQGHMVMGQEERKNKARLEKAQLALTTSNAEYENAIKALEKTTDRWNRQWKEACDVRRCSPYFETALTRPRRSKTWKKNGSIT